MFGYAGAIFNGTMDVFEGLGSFGADVTRATGKLGTGDVSGAADVIVNSVQEDLMAKSLMGLFGPEGVGGTIIGALPEPVRDVGGSIIDPIFGGITWVLEEVVDRPLGTALTLMNVSYKDTGALFDLSTYAKAYAINDERTAGQALMAAAYFIDPFDQEDFNGLRDKPIFNLVSGTVDFALEFADPTVYFGSMGIKAARGGAVFAKANKAGRITGTYGRRFTNSTRSSRLVVKPHLNNVYGPGMGARPATIANKKIPGLTATPTQTARRQNVVDMFVDERANNFVASDRFHDLNNAVQAGATAGERSRIAKVLMGKSARHLSSQDIARWAGGETTAARELSMRVMLGDATAHHQAIKTAREVDTMFSSEKWAEVDTFRKMQIASPDLPVTVSDEILQMSKDYDALVSSVDWSLVHHMDEALREAMPKELIVDVETGLYRVSDNAQNTLRTIDTGVTHRAIEDMLGKLDELGFEKTNSVFTHVGSIRGMPNGSRLRELFKYQAKHLDDTADSMAVTSIVDKNTVSGHETVINFVTERLAHSRVYFHDSQSTIQVERVLRDATRLEFPDGRRLLSGEEAARIVQKYEDLRAVGDIAAASELFLTTVGRINKEADNLFHKVFERQSDGVAYVKHLENEWDLAQSKIVDNAVDGEKSTVVGLTDDKGIVNRSAIIDESEPGKIHVANVRLSPKQLEQSAVLPRYDILQKNLERAMRRQSDVPVERIRAKASDLVVGAGRVVRRTSDQPMKYWRAGVLLTPKWPMRITIEEQLRMGTQLGVATTALNFFQGVSSLRRAYAFFNFPNDKLLSDTDMIVNALRSSLGDTVGAGRVRNIDEALDVQKVEYGQVKKMPDAEKTRRKNLQNEKKVLLRVDDLSPTELVDAVGVEGFQTIIDQLIREKVLTRRELRATYRNTGLKSLAISALFMNPFVGGMYGYVSYGRKTKRMMQAGQRQAATNMAGALKAEGRRMMAGGQRADSAYRAGMDMMSEADYINKLVEGGNKNAAKARNSFELADELLEEAGFGKINIGGQAFRSGFGDDPRFVEQIQREVSANNYAQAVLRGAHNSVKQNLDNIGYVRTNVLAPANAAERRSLFDDRWAETIARFSSASGNDAFFNIVWGNQTIETRVRRLEDLLKKDDNLFSSLVSDRLPQFQDDLDYRSISEFMVKEYEGILPSGDFADLREIIRTGGEVKWTHVESRLQTGLKDRTPEQNFRANVEEIKKLNPQFGEVIHPESVVTKTRYTEKIDGYIENLFRMFGTLPSDELSRFPFYKSVYDGEVRRVTEGLIDPDGFLRISQNRMDDIEREAREYSLKRTREVLYDLSEQTRIGEVIGNASPFFNAWQEVLGRWGGFAVDNPMFVAKVGQIYRQPWEAEFLGLTEVSVGEGDEEDKYIVWRPLGDAYDEEGNPTSVFNALPGPLKHMFFPPALRDGEMPVRFSKNGFNMVAQGTPGFGPLITVPLREAMLEEPELENTLAFMFPFGHPHGGFLERLGTSLAPSWGKNLKNLLVETHTKKTVLNRVFRDLTIQMADAGDPLDWNDELAVMEVLEEAEKRTQNFFFFRVGTGLFSPTSTTLLSPFDPLSQSYRDMEQEFGFKEAQTKFLDEHGPEFFALTGRMSTLNDGVRATVENEELYQENQALIQAHPAIGAWISGSVGPVDENYVFSQVAYNRQFNQPVGGASDVNRRSVKSPVEYVEDTQVAQGWLEYSALNDEIRIMQDQAGAVGLSTSLQSNHMQRVAALKKQVIEGISAKFPAWRKEFDDFGSSNQKMNDVYDGVAAALQYENIVARPSTVHLLEYLSLRIEVQGMLDYRKGRGGSNNITAGDNTDIEQFWFENKEDIGDRPDFSPLYDRYFERDKLLPQTFINAEDFPMSGMPRYT